MDLTAAQITEACGGRLLAGDPDRRFHSICLDSRAVQAGSLFAALPGARVDGHSFVATALHNGAAGALVMRPTPHPEEAVVIQVDETTAALQTLASWWRDRLQATVIGVAGSNGKTTTKEVLAAVFGRAGKTWATPRNANSQVGAPLALLGAPLDAEFVVLELGTSAPGELARLAKMARPHHAIITAAFAEHLEWLGDIAGVIAAETEILDSLEPRGLALIGSAEIGLVEAARQRHQVRVEALGRRVEDDWHLHELQTSAEGTQFDISGPELGKKQWKIPLLGEPAAWAGAFAVALATRLGIDPDQIQAGFDRVRPADHRLVPLLHPRRPLLVLDDCYNSNPASCIAAVDTADALTQAGERLVLVIGDMRELGDATADAHEEVGLAIGQRAAKIGTLVAVGPESARIAEIATNANIDARHVEDADQATRVVDEILADGVKTTVLAKASRSIGLDRLVGVLMTP